MNRIINIKVITLIVTLTMVVMQGQPFNETIGQKNHQHINAGETATNIKDFDQENLEHPNALKNATEARALPFKDSADFFKDEASPKDATKNFTFHTEELEPLGTKDDHIARNNQVEQAVVQAGKLLTQSQLGNDELNESNTDPCPCSLNDLKKYLAPFIGPDPLFLPTHVGEKPQKFTLSNLITLNEACRIAGGTRVETVLKFTDTESHQEINNLRHKNFSWDALKNELTFGLYSKDSAVLHKVLLNIYDPCFKDVIETVEIEYFVNSSPKPEPQNKLSELVEGENSELNTEKSRQLPTSASDYCLNSPYKLNLLNTSALAEQSSFMSTCSQTTSTGCDGDVKEIDIVNSTGNPYQLTTTKIVCPEKSYQSTPQWWKVTFQQQTSIKTTLFINRDDEVNTGGRFPLYNVTVGYNADVTLNPTCVTPGTMTEGGWYFCPTQMTGTTFGVYLNRANYLNFLEAMAYSQEAIQMNALSVSLIGTNLFGYPVSNSLQNIVVPLITKTGQKCVMITAPTDGQATFSIKFKAQITINGVVVISGYQTSISMWPIYQTNVAISGRTVGGAEQLCGVLGEYYTKYGEILCNIQANEIILVQQTVGYGLRFCGFGALSDCECAQSSFNPSFFTTTPSTSFVSATLLQLKATDSVQTIIFNSKMLDTISSVCGSADGVSKCGLRVLTFKDKTTKMPVTFPYKGFQFYPESFVLTLDPAQAIAICVLTATIQLANYPQVSFSQDITAIVQPIFVPPMSLDATINQYAYLQLPDFNFTYVIMIKPTFQASINGNQLKVLSTNDKDVGKQYLYLAAQYTNKSQSFLVKINFKESSKQITNTNITTQPVQEVANSTNLTSSSDLVDFSQMNCTTDDNGNLKTCVSLINSRFTCLLDEGTGQMVCGLDLKKKEAKNDQPLAQPTMVISEINKRGFFDLKFSKPMDFLSLFNTGKDRKGGGRSSGYSAQAKSDANSTNTADLNFSLYLLSDLHLSITLLSGGDQDHSELEFEWFAVNITETKIKIQVLFEHPAYISTDAHNPDYLAIELLPSSLLAFQSKQSHQNINMPLRTENKRLPTQLKLDTVTDNVEAAAQNLESVTTWTVIGNFSLSIFLSGVLQRIFTMANSLQMVMASCRLNVAVPANVYLVTQKLNDVASFNFLPADKIMAYCFNFSTTLMPNVAFQAMGTLNMRLTPYLGSIFIAIVLILALSLFYCITYPCRNLDKVLSRVHKKMQANYYWSGIIRLILEGFSDFCTGIMLSINDPRFTTGSDIFDFVLTCFFALLVISGPISAYLLLRKYDTQLDEEEFQTKFGSLTEGYYTTGAIGTSKTRTIVVWYMVRRIFTAVVIVQMGDLSPWLLITANIYLALGDAIINWYCFPYVSQMGGIVATFNDFLVLILSYFPYLYAGLVPDPETRYTAGWLQASLLGLMLVVNLIVVGINMVIEITTELRRVRIERHNFQELKRLGYDVVVVGMAPWQIIARFCQVDWLCFDAVPRINVQIADQMREYYRQLSEQIQILNIYFQTRANQHVLKQEMRQIQHDAYMASQDQEIGAAQLQSKISNNQVVPCQLIQQNRVLTDQPITTAAKAIELRRDWIIRNLKRASLPESQLIEEQATAVKKSRDKSISAAEKIRKKTDWMIRNLERASQPESQLILEQVTKAQQSRRAIGSTELMIQNSQEFQEVELIHEKQVDIQQVLEFVKQILWNLRNSHDSKLRETSMPIDVNLIVDFLPATFLSLTHREQVKEVKDLLFMFKEETSKAAYDEKIARVEALIAAERRKPEIQQDRTIQLRERK